MSNTGIVWVIRCFMGNIAALWIYYFMYIVYTFKITDL